jgi:hypothetical protein
VCDSFGSRSPVGHERTRAEAVLSTAPPSNACSLMSNWTHALSEQLSADLGSFTNPRCSLPARSNELVKRRLDDAALAQVTARPGCEGVRRPSPPSLTRCVTLNPTRVSKIPQRAAGSISLGVHARRQWSSESSIAPLCPGAGDVLACYVTSVPCFAQSLHVSAHAEHVLED